ncbi:MAG: rod shape-determining protein MreC [Burkholderiales bacterium]|nr:rod shape-determining protein MreC [Burkholderiales bacterium]MBZ0251424.1 rod shape-determining protein MreC [Burkholderiales bacterium]MCL4689868.1 rod shape-determining protein MreC [Burkholderiales bacterium]
MIREPPPFFHRGPSPLARLTFFALLAIATMIADHRFGALEAVRLSLSVLVAPLQGLAAAPGAALARVADYFASQDRLLRDNEALQAKLLEYSAAAQQAKLLAAEQQQFLAMTPPRSRFGAEGVIAEVLTYGRNPFVRKLVLDKGLTHGIKAGMPVIDAEGVVGQVTAVGTFTSEVTLLTEKDQSVPVMLVRNGLRAIAVGSGKGGSIDVPFMPVSADIQNGDLFVTSGIDGTYPAGLVVARVAAVEKNAAYVFARITALPAAGVDHHRFVRILTSPRPALPAPPASRPEERRAPARGRRQP